MRRLSGLTLGVGVVTALAIIGGCGGGDGGGGGGGPSGTGLADVELRVPAGVTDGIALVTVTGGTIKDVQSAGPAGPQFRAVGEDTPTAQIIARGTFTGSAAKLATICIDNIEDLADFQADVIQVAGGQADAYAVRVVAAYTATLTTPRTAVSCP